MSHLFIYTGWDGLSVHSEEFFILFFFLSSLNEVAKTDTMMDIVHLNITVLAIRNYTELPVSEDLNVPVLLLNHYKKNSWEE